MSQVEKRLSNAQPAVKLSLRDGHGEAGVGVELTDITDDSRQVGPGVLYVHRADRSNYLEQAIKTGAAAIVATPEQWALFHADHKTTTTATTSDATATVLIEANQVDQILAWQLAIAFFADPAEQLKLVGITGTNGKTTVSFLIQHLLNQAEVKAGLIGTIWNDVGAATGPATAELTTPGAIEFVRMLHQMVENGCKAAVAEVSSHALHQHRVDAAIFDVAVFTNLTQDHLDYHGTMDEYAAAKAILFESLGEHAAAIVNMDDAYAARMIRDCRARIVPTSIAGIIHELTASFSEATFVGPWGHADSDEHQPSVTAKLPLIGEHNVANALQALHAAHCITDLSEDFMRRVETLTGVPGRLERVTVNEHEGKPDIDLPAVLVDYAHTPDALHNVLRSLRPITANRLIVVFGCGGDRDRTKRPLMAAAACEFGDIVILTSDNPRTEDPQTILNDALQGVPDPMKEAVMPMLDRAEAIQKAIHLAQAGDTVLIAGKGHEDYQVVGTTKRHFDDREHAREALKSRLAMS